MLVSEKVLSSILSATTFLLFFGALRTEMIYEASLFSTIKMMSCM